jgi:hypothetical protein
LSQDGCRQLKPKRRSLDQIPKIEMVSNLVEVPSSLLARADEVIE